MIVSAKDHMLPPAMEEANVQKLKARGTILPACHVAMLEDPAAVAAVIDEAAQKSLAR